MQKFYLISASKSEEIFLICVETVIKRRVISLATIDFACCRVCHTFNKLEILIWGLILSCGRYLSRGISKQHSAQKNLSTKIFFSIKK